MDEDQTALAGSLPVEVPLDRLPSVMYLHSGEIDIRIYVDSLSPTARAQAIYFLENLP